MRSVVDKQGRQVQFPLGFVTRILIVVVGVAVLLFACKRATSGEMRDIQLCVAWIVIFLFILIFVRVSGAWYYEDEYGFETLTPFSHKRVAISYSDIDAWLISRKRVLYIKTRDNQKVRVSLVDYRPLILLNTLAAMEKEGRFVLYASKEDHSESIVRLNEVLRSL